MQPDQRRALGSKLSRSETVTIRLDPKLRYLAELAASKHRRTLSSFIEWAIQDSLSRVTLSEGSGFTVADQSSYLWDVDEPDRFAKLALRYPDLLNHEEQKRWKLIRENGYLWRERSGSRWTPEEKNLCFDRLREHWAVFCAVAKGDAGSDVLPTWSDQKTEDSEDIPF